MNPSQENPQVPNENKDAKEGVGENIITKEMVQVAASGVESQGPSGINIEDATYATALEAAGSGCFTVILMVVSIAGGWAAWISTSVISVMLSVAECDLMLSLTDKGALNAITFAGMMSTALLWGYLSDTFGRRNLIIVCAFLDLIFVIMGALSQTFVTLLLSKFFSGCFVNGSYTILVTYTSELLQQKYRSKFLLLQAMFNMISLILLPIVGLIILPSKIEIKLSENFVIHQWGIFLAICGSPGLVLFIGMIFMHESPKFSMTVGRNEEALKALRRIYAINTRKPQNSYPIKSLVNEIAIRDKKGYEHGGKVTANRSRKTAFKESCQQIKPLYYPPYRSRGILIISINFLLTSGTNSIRLWAPEILKNIFLQNTKYIDLCLSLASNKLNKTVIKDVTANQSTICKSDIKPEVYYYLTMFSTAVLLLFGISSFIVNRIGQRMLLISYTSTASICALSLYFVRFGTVPVITILAILLSFGSVAVTLVVIMVVELVPTYLRAMLLSIAILSGRLGSMSGSLIFPVFIKYTGCPGPFVFVCLCYIGVFVLSLFLPQVDPKTLD